MTATLGKGDTVILRPLRAVITHDYNDGDYDLRLEDGKSAMTLPMEAIALVKRAAPEEPSPGTVIYYRDNAGGRDYYRDGDQWKRVIPFVYSIPMRWVDFDHTRVYYYTKASKPLV